VSTVKVAARAATSTVLTPHKKYKLPDEIKRNAEFRCAVGDRLCNVGNAA